MNFDRQYAKNQRLESADPHSPIAKLRGERLQARKDLNSSEKLPSELIGQLGLQLRISQDEYFEAEEFQDAVHTLIKFLIRNQTRTVQCRYLGRNKNGESLYLDHYDLHSLTVLLFSDDAKSLEELRASINKLGPYEHYWDGPKVMLGARPIESFTAHNTYKRQTSCPGAYGHVDFQFSPQELDAPNFTLGPDARRDLLSYKGHDDRGFVRGVRKALKEFLANYGALQIQFELRSVRVHMVDSRERCFYIATRQLLQILAEALTKFPLEPLMNFEWQIDNGDKDFVENVCLSDFEELFKVEDIPGGQYLLGRTRLSSTLCWPLTPKLRKGLYLDFHSYVLARDDVDGFSLFGTPWKSLDDACRFYPEFRVRHR